LTPEAGPLYVEVEVAMNKRTLFASAIFAILLLATIGLLRSPEKGTQPPGERPRAIPKLSAGDFDTLEVTKAGSTTVMKRQGDGYQMVKPVDYLADKESAKTAFESFEKLDFGNILSSEKGRRKEFEVDDDGLRVAIKKGDKLIADLRVGKMAGAETMVRLEGKDEVWGARDIYKYQLDKDTFGWRDKHISMFDVKDAVKIELVSKTGGRIVLTRPAPADGGTPANWSAAESAVKVEPFDQRAATDVVTTCSAFAANQFADGAKPEETGLDSPENSITVSLRTGKQHQILVGKKKSDDETYVKTADKPQVFLVKKATLDLLNKRPIDFRDKTVCNLTADEIAEVSVARSKDPFALARPLGKMGVDVWKVTKPAGLQPDISKANAIAGFFLDWKAQGFADDNSPKTTGLAKPATIISVKSKVPGHACTLKVGGETSDKSNVYVMANNQPDIFVVAKWAIDRVAVKLEEVKAK
jgi:hypothetical protein